MAEYHVRAGKARHSHLKDQGADVYAAFQSAAGKRGYQATLERHGSQFTKTVVEKAHVAGCLKRLAHPSTGEALLIDLLTELGYTVLTPDIPYTYNPDDTHDDMTILREVRFGAFFVDFYVPALHLVIEVHGGCHVLQRERDAWRTHELMSRFGVQVVIICDQTILDSGVVPLLNQVLA